MVQSGLSVHKKYSKLKRISVALFHFLAISQSKFITNIRLQTGKMAIVDGGLWMVDGKLLMVDGTLFMVDA